MSDINDSRAIASSANHSHAIVVEGGAMRGIFASGVLDALMSVGITQFDLAIGVSAGATNLSGLVAHRPGRSRRAIMEFARQKEFFSPVRFLRGGHMTDVHWLWHYTHEQDPLTGLNPNTRFLATATHVETGAAHYLEVTEDNLHDAMVASCAIPYLYREPVMVAGEAYVDGGVADSIPVRQAYELGARDITVVLSQPLGFRKKEGQSWLLDKLFADSPALVEALHRRAADYNASLDFMHNPPSDCRVHVIAPPTEFAVSRLCMNEKKLNDGYAMGSVAALQYLAQKHPTLSVA